MSREDAQALVASQTLEEKLRLENLLKLLFFKENGGPEW